jgi:hypothetical protein
MRYFRWKTTAVLAVLILTGMRVYVHVVPRGAEFLPYILASVRGPEIKTPDGEIGLRVMFNDAGAAHSGNHWTWIVKNDWLLGKRVIAKDYSGSAVRFGERRFPIKWLDNRTAEIEFVAGRQNNKPKVVQMTL